MVKCLVKTVGGAFAVSLILVSCGGGDLPQLEQSEEQNSAQGGEQNSAQGGEQNSVFGGTGTEIDLEAAATQSFTAFANGDDATYFNLLSLSCRELQFAAVEGHLDGRRYRIDIADTTDLFQVGVSSVEITSFDGASATVSLTLSGTNDQFVENLRRSWVFEDGWRLNECSDITPAQGGLEGIGTNRSEPLIVGGVTDIDGWLVSLSFVEANFELTYITFGGSPATEGTQLYSAWLGLTYIGTDAISILGENLEFAIVSENQVYGIEAGCEQVDDLLLDPSLESGPGESLPPKVVCREIPLDDLENLLLRITHLATGDEFWFDLS